MHITRATGAGNVTERPLMFVYTTGNPQWFLTAAMMVFASVVLTAGRCETSRSDPTPQSPPPSTATGPTFVPFDADLVFASFARIQDQVGFRILRAPKDTYRTEVFNRSLEAGPNGWRYYEAYSLLDGPDQAVVVGVTQQPVVEFETDSTWHASSVSGHKAQVRSEAGRYEVRFLTGAVSEQGLSVEARVVGVDSGSVLRLVSALEFDE